MAVQELGKLVIDIEARLDKLEKGMKKAEGRVESSAKRMGDTFKKLAIYGGIGLGAQELLSFGKEAIKLAGKVEGVREAFSKLNDKNLLRELKEATRGTVSELELMQTAVRAANFKIPLDELATLLEFATKRAAQTGESVDYLVNSIIDGIGRKSTLVLDNLGISATELQEEVKKVGDFGKATGNIVSRELEKMGEVSLTTQQKIAKINAQWENMTVAIGEGLTPTINELTDSINDLTDSTSGIAETIDTILKTVGIIPRRLFLGPEAVEGTIYDRIYKSVVGTEKKTLELINTHTYYAEQKKKEFERQNQIAGLEKLVSNEIDTQVQKEKTHLKILREINAQLHLGAKVYDEFLAKEAKYKNQLAGRGDDKGSSGSPDQAISSIDALNERVQKLIRTNQAASTAFNTLEAGAMGFFDDLIIKADWANSMLEKGFVSMANSFIREVERMIAEWLAFQAIKGLFGFLLAPFTGGASAAAAVAHSGGTFVNEKGNLNQLPSFAMGGSAIVPPGYPNDSALLRVESGERIDVTPASQVGGPNDIARKLDRLTNAVMAQTNVLHQLDLNVSVYNNAPDVESKVKRNKKVENRLLKRNEKFDEL